ncbi:hypothetical protein DMUE_0896 [Dictyocoela muelleri]|nr:hypothetical protein DMUE_0896 [Dictyocoela muelleri]
MDIQDAYSFHVNRLCKLIKNFELNRIIDALIFYDAEVIILDFCGLMKKIYHKYFIPKNLSYTYYFVIDYEECKDEILNFNDVVLVFVDYKYRFLNFKDNFIVIKDVYS